MPASSKMCKPTLNPPHLQSQRLPNLKLKRRRKPQNNPSPPKRPPLPPHPSRPPFSTSASATSCAASHTQTLTRSSSPQSPWVTRKEQNTHKYVKKPEK